MRRSLLTCCVLTLLAPGGARADDDPKPPVVLAKDECEALLDGLLAEVETERAAARARLAQADEALLRRLVARLLRRVEEAGPEGGRDLDPQDPRPHLAPQVEEPVDLKAPMVTLEVRLLEVSAAAAERLLATGTKGVDGSTTFDAARLAAELAALGTSGGATLITAPRLTALLGQRADISVLNQFSYVQDYEVESVTNVADPVIGTLQEGMVLEVRAMRSGAGLLVNAKLSLSDVVRPIPEFKTRLAAEGPEVTLQLPELRVQRWERRLAVTPGSPVLLASMDMLEPGQGRRLLAFLGAELLVVDHPDDPAPVPDAPQPGEAPGR